MGKQNKNTNKTKAKGLSEADAAAGMMVANKDPEPPKEKRPREPQPKLTRKQKRQKLNDKNKWPQHPKITNPEQREKAYLRVAGIEPLSQEQEDKPQFVPAAAEKVKPLKDDADDEWRRFGRFLGGTDARTRHRAVKRLGQYLQAKSGFGVDGEQLNQVAGLSELDLLKLWKGLWFTLYMADKVPVQDELAKQIAKLIWCVAGDQEADDFAAQTYLDMLALEEMELEQAQLEEGDEGEEEGEDDDGVQILGAEYVEVSDDDEEDDDAKLARIAKAVKAVKAANKKLKQDKDGESNDDSDDDDDEEANGDEEEDMDVEEELEDEEEEEEDRQETKHVRGAHLANLFVRTFFSTLVREWGKMDKYRVDKFYTLTRYMVREIYRYMAQRQWSLGIIKLFNDAITEEALMKQPNGVRYHLIDIALEELVLVATKSGVLPVTEAIFLEVFEPYFTMAQHGFGDKTVQARVVEKILEKFLMEYSLVRELPSEDDDKNEKKPMLEDVHVGTVSKFIFEMGSDGGTLDMHRKGLYEMHKTYERQRKKMGTDIEVGKGFIKCGECVEEDEDYQVEEEVEAEDDEDLEQMGFVPEEGDDDDDKQEAPPAKESKKEKKKKRKHKKEKQEAEIKAPPEPKENDDNKPSKKQKNKNSKKTGDLDTTIHSNKETPSETENKHKNKKHDKAQTPEKAVEDEQEEVVTISKAEQKKAKEVLKKQEEPKEAEEKKQSPNDSGRKKKKKKKDKQGDKEEDGEGGRKKMERRVSFGDKNTARSWKASMKGLRQLDPSETISKTPEKSILLNKDKKPRSKSAPAKGRKRAVDYF